MEKRADYIIVSRNFEDTYFIPSLTNTGIVLPTVKQRINRFINHIKNYRIKLENPKVEEIGISSTPINSSQILKKVEQKDIIGAVIETTLDEINFQLPKKKEILEKFEELKETNGQIPLMVIKTREIRIIDKEKLEPVLREENRKEPTVEDFKRYGKKIKEEIIIHFPSKNKILVFPPDLENSKEIHLEQVFRKTPSFLNKEIIKILVRFHYEELKRKLNLYKNQNRKIFNNTDYKFISLNTKQILSEKLIRYYVLKLSKLIRKIFEKFVYFNYLQASPYVNNYLLEELNKELVLNKKQEHLGILDKVKTEKLLVLEHLLTKSHDLSYYASELFNKYYKVYFFNEELKVEILDLLKDLRDILNSEEKQKYSLVKSIVKEIYGKLKEAEDMGLRSEYTDQFLKIVSYLKKSNLKKAKTELNEFIKKFSNHELKFNSILNPYEKDNLVKVFDLMKRINFIVFTRKNSEKLQIMANKIYRNKIKARQQFITETSLTPNIKRILNETQSAKELKRARELFRTETYENPEKRLEELKHYVNIDYLPPMQKKNVFRLFIAKDFNDIIKIAKEILTSLSEKYEDIKASFSEIESNIVLGNWKEGFNNIKNLLRKYNSDILNKYTRILLETPDLTAKEKEMLLSMTHLMKKAEIYYPILKTMTAKSPHKQELTNTLKNIEYLYDIDKNVASSFAQGLGEKMAMLGFALSEVADILNSTVNNNIKDTVISSYKIAKRSLQNDVLTEIDYNPFGEIVI